MADAPASFGAGLAARSRPRMAATAHVHRASSIGAVGRSTLGFGRIIATAGSSRPTVTPDVLATRSLRPPLGVWTLLGHDDTAESPESTRTVATPWTTSALRPSNNLRRSTVPAPAPAPAPRPASAAPTPSKGTGKVDALRRLLESRGMIEPSEPAAVPSPAAGAATQPARRDPAAPGDRTATTAGADTAPGRFARRVRPEPTAPESPLSSVFPEGVPGPRSPVRRASGPDDLDRFRRTLEARGMISPDASGTSGAPDASGAPGVRRPDSARPAVTPRPRPSERSTRPKSPPASDGDAEGAPVSPSRSLPFALAPEVAPAPTRGALQRAIEPGGLAYRGIAEHDPAAAAFDATVGSSIAPAAVAVTGTADTADRTAPTHPGSNIAAANTATTNIAPNTVSPATASPTTSPGVAAAPATSASPTSPATTSATITSPATHSPNTVGQVDAARRRDQSVASVASVGSVAPTAPPVRRSEIRRVELRRLAHRIGLDRTLSTSAGAEAIAAAGHVADRVAPPVATLGSAGHDPAGSEPIRRSPESPAAPSTSPAHAAGSPVTTVTRNSTETRAPSVGDVARSARAPIVVTRAHEARTATRNVRHRMAGRRFVDAESPGARTAPTDRVAPGVAAAAASPAHGTGVIGAMNDESTVRRSLEPHGSHGSMSLRSPIVSSLSSPDMSPRVRSAVAAGPGALRRALLSHSDTLDAPALPAARSTPTPRTPATSPQNTTTTATTAASTAPAASTSAPARSIGQQGDAAEAVSRSGRPSGDRPAAPDPARLADTTAARLATTAPAVIHRSPDPTPAGDSIASDGDLGARFLRELGRAPDHSARELPTPFRPLATAITGSARHVRVSSDHVSRHALESVGKQAVTVGDTIHLVRPPRDDVRTTEVLAHELVHVANPSPVPRFFDDDHRGPEERLAEQVAQVIARSPVMPGSPVPSNRSSGADVVRRSPAPRRSAATSSSAGAVSAAALADALAGRSSGSGSSHPGSSGSGSFGDGSDRIRRSPRTSSSSAMTGNDDAQSEYGGGAAAGLFGSGTREERDRFDALMERSIDRVVRRVEERVIAELERRGGRYWRNF